MSFTTLRCLLLSISVLLGAGLQAQETKPLKHYTDSLDFSAAPQRSTDQLPLSDQKNSGGWELNTSLSDEFKGRKLNETKWYPNNPKWKGRPPTFFHGSNIRQKGGEVVVRVNQHGKEALPEGFTHTTGFIKSREKFLYGYIEAELKPMDAPWVSGFWLTNVDKDWWTEIDICENAPGVKWNRHDLNSNVHVFRAPPGKGNVTEHFALNKKYYVPFELQKDYHVWGLEWTPEFIRFYLDGVLFREQENTHWHQPLEININCESNKWFGALPDDDRLKGKMKVKYVRVWSKDFPEKKVAADWEALPVPAPAGPGMEWTLLEDYSDDFNYSGKPEAFTKRWRSAYMSKWEGPGLTRWREDHSQVENGNLVIRASRESDGKVGAGIITSQKPISYPVYTEARIKASNLELSSNFWMLSKDAKREIDVLEVYGGTEAWPHPTRATTNFHLFKRDASGIHGDFNDLSGHYLPDTTPWRMDYHTFGVFWKSPTEVSFYIDGKEMENSSWADAKLFDQNYTKTYLDKSVDNMDRPMYLILDTEDHDWRVEKGNTPTDEELADDSRNRMYVDWVRTYTLTSAEK
ncbi:family 16 glycosylhydrolase [Neolewinella aurantiaca]|uniref:family 16 glycosylhydrolase n=1 Tax=Neolewinella aurantiaca TaxID=2602767 RepID=UPI00165090E2|nr:family 16 glycosylhydrolase [Neolewinella aurantiaca]